MVTRSESTGRTRALLGAILVVALLLTILATLEGTNSGVACTDVAPAVEAFDSPAEISENAHDVLTSVANDPTAKKDDAAAKTPMTPWTVRGIVIDEATSEPVPWLDVALSTSSGKAKVQTGADGRFTSMLQLVAGAVDARITDADLDVGSAHVDREALSESSEWSIPIPIGPTVSFVSIDGVYAYFHWSARIVQWPYPMGSAGEIDVDGTALRLAGPTEPVEWPWLPLREVAGTVFVRWPKIVHASSPSMHPRVFVSNERTLRRGSTDIASTVGIQPPINPVTQAYTIVSGSILLRDDRHPPPIHVLVSEDVAADQVVFERPPFFAETVVKNLAYEVEAPSAGPLRVVAWADGSRGDVSQSLMTAKCVVNPFGSMVVAPDLALLPDSRGGQTRLKLESFEWMRDTRSQVVRISLSDAGRFSEPWFFDTNSNGIDTSTLPCGEFVVETIGLNAEPILARAFDQQRLPAPSLDTSHGTSGERGLYFIHAIDSRKESSPRDIAITAGPAGSMFTTRDENSPRAWTLSSTNNVVFHAWAPGCIPRQVTMKDFDEERDAHVAHVNLQPGWGTLLVFKVGDPKEVAKRTTAKLKKSGDRRSNNDAFAMPPIPGVRVMAGSQTLAVSDVDGCALVDRLLAPDRLWLVADGWRMVSLEKIAGPGSRWFVWLKRYP